MCLLCYELGNTSSFNIKSGPLFIASTVWSSHLRTTNKAQYLRPFHRSQFPAALHKVLLLSRQCEQQSTATSQPAKPSSIDHTNGGIFNLSSTESGKTHGGHNLFNIVKGALIVSWMMASAADNGKKHVAPKALRNLPQFLLASKSDTFTMATKTQGDCTNYTDQNGTNASKDVVYLETSVAMASLKGMRIEASRCGGRKHFKWVKALCLDSRDKFCQPQKFEVKFNRTF